MQLYIFVVYLQQMDCYKQKKLAMRKIYSTTGFFVLLATYLIPTCFLCHIEAVKLQILKLCLPNGKN